jgi:hypothetical protein
VNWRGCSGAGLVRGNSLEEKEAVTASFAVTFGMAIFPPDFDEEPTTAEDPRA